MEITIEKMIYGGEGLARVAQAGETRSQTAFVPFVLPGERVEATATEQKPGLIRTRLERVIEASRERTEPGCPYFRACGGCQYQHADYAKQLEIKDAILRETLERTAKIRWAGDIHTHGSPPWNYRNRTRLKLCVAPFAMGYYKFQSHELLPVEQCPISSPLINRAIDWLWQLGRSGAVAPEITEVELFASAEDTELLVEVYEDARAPMAEEAMAEFAGELRAALPEIRGIAIFESGRNNSAERRRLGSAMEAKLGDSEMTYRTGGAKYRVSAGSFFQVNRFLTEKLIEIAVGGRKDNAALDLYAGVGLFAVQLARQFERVVAVESGAGAFEDLRKNLPRNAKARRGTAEQYLDEARGEFDFVVVDPPRAGLGKRVAQQLAKLGAPQLAYVSCDPATLARDLQVLTAGGYEIEEIDMVDLFPQTFHLETVVKMKRPGRRE